LGSNTLHLTTETAKIVSVNTISNMPHKLNKPLAGYHLLMILSQVDGKFDKEAGDIIVDYLKENFPFRVNLDYEIEELSTLLREQYEEHFEKCMNDFYDDSTEEERNHFLDFAVKLTKTDNVISENENHYLAMLFNAWAPEFEEEV
jgi:hypothetical protein